MQLGLLAPYVVIGDLRAVVVPEDAVVDPSEVREVDEVLDPAVRAGVPLVDVAHHRAEGGVLELGEPGQGHPRLLLQTDPHQPVGLLGEVRSQPRTLGDHGPEARRDGGARAVRSVGPPVVRAPQHVTVDPTARHGRAAVGAQVGEAADLAGHPYQRQLHVQEHHLCRCVAQVARQHHREPEVPHSPVQPGLAGLVEVVREMVRRTVPYESLGHWSQPPPLTR